MGKVYFTIDPGGGGFTDQLHKFRYFYKLGRSLDFEYLHRPFRAPRSSPAIFDHIGLNDHLMPASRMRRWLDRFRLLTRPRLRMAVNSFVLETEGVTTFDGLHAYVRKKVAEAGSTWRGSALVEFSYRKAPGGGGFFGWIDRAVPELPDGLDLRAVYFRARGRSGQGEEGTSGRAFRVVVHIRQGDIAFVPTPWKTVVSVHPKTGVRKLDTESAEARSNIAPGEYAVFLRRMLEWAAGAEVKGKVFSDGYERAFDMMLQGGRQNDLSSEQRAEMEKLRTGFDARQFESFAAVPGFSSVIGESDEKLFDLTRSILEADIVICGDRQNLIRKMMANFPDKERKQLVFILSNGSRESVESRFGSERGCHTVIPVALRDAGSMEAARQGLASYLSHRSANHDAS